MGFYAKFFSTDRDAFWLFSAVEFAFIMLFAYIDSILLIVLPLAVLDGIFVIKKNDIDPPTKKNVLQGIAIVSVVAALILLDCIK